jgi:uncharacterized membrane protein
MQEIIISYFSTLPKEWAVFFLSMIPITELRATIPLAIIKFEMAPWLAFFYAVTGNTLMGSLVFLLVKPTVERAIGKIEFLHKIWQKYIDRIFLKNEKKFEKWGSLALVTFIAIPLPMTGAFTGAVAASIFQIPFKKTLPLIFTGCLISGMIMTVASVWFREIF